MASLSPLHLSEQSNQPVSPVQQVTWIHRAKNGLLKTWKVVRERKTFVTEAIAILLVISLAFIYWPAAIIVACTLPFVIWIERSKLDPLMKENQKLREDKAVLKENNQVLYGQANADRVARERLTIDVRQISEERDQIMRDRMIEAETTARLTIQNNELSKLSDELRTDKLAAVAGREQVEKQSLEVIQGKAHLSRRVEQLIHEFDLLKQTHLSATEELEKLKAEGLRHEEAESRAIQQMSRLQALLAEKEQERLLATQELNRSKTAILDEQIGKSKLAREHQEYLNERESLQSAIDTLKRERDESIQAKDRLQLRLDQSELRSNLRIPSLKSPQKRLEELMGCFEDHKRERCQMLEGAIKDLLQDSPQRIHLEEILRITKEESSIIRGRIAETLYLDSEIRDSAGISDDFHNLSLTEPFVKSSEV